MRRGNRWCGRYDTTVIVNRHDPVGLFGSAATFAVEPITAAPGDTADAVTWVPPVWSTPVVLTDTTAGSEIVGWPLLLPKCR
jgi:hypothetical protein